MRVTVSDVAERALERASQFTSDLSTPRSVMYRRIGRRQQELVEMASHVNADYYGRSATVVLDDGDADLNDMDTQVPDPARVQKVVIDAPGSSGYVAGTEVTIVPIGDTEAGIAPRGTIRQHLFADVNDELLGVTSLVFHYTEMPEAVLPTDDDRTVITPEPHDELLVLDLAQHLLRYAGQIDKDGRALALKALEDEEKEAVAGWLAHVRGFAPFARRFSDEDNSHEGA